MNLDETIIKEIEQANEIEDTDGKEVNYHLQIIGGLIHADAKGIIPGQLE